MVKYIQTSNIQFNMKSEKTRKRRHFRWALWTGLGLYALGNILTSIFDTDIRTEDFIEDGFGSGLWPTLILVGIVVPLLEETSFRLWAVGWRRKRAMRTLYLVGGALAAIYVALNTSWWAGAVALAVMLACTLVPRDDRKRTLLMLVATSASFGIAHAGNVGTWDWSVPIYFAALAGFGLMAAYLVLNHSLIWSILLHMVVNCFYVLVTFYIPGEPVKLETERYAMELSPFRKMEYMVEEHSGDTVWIRGSLPAIADNLVQSQQYADSVPIYSQPVRHHYAKGSWRLPTMQLQMVDRQGGKQDYMQALRALMDEGLVASDTTYEPLWTLRIADTALAASATGSSHGFLTDFIISMQLWYNMPIMVAEGEDERFPLCYEHESLVTCPDRDSCLRLIEQTYGLHAEPDPQQRMMQIITFSAKSNP